MDRNTRWLAVAAALGLCTAYALSGGGYAPVAPEAAPRVQPGGEQPGAPPQAARAPAAARARSALKFNPASVDFGEVLVHESRHKDAALENTGAQPVNITNVRGNCGCLKIEVPQTRVEPGKSAVVKLTFTGQPGKRTEGYAAMLTTDEPESPVALLPVRGKVKQVFIVDPQTLYFDKVAKGQTKTLEATIKQAQGLPFTVKNVAASHKEFSFKWEPLAGGGYKILATVQGQQIGPLTEGAAIVTDHPVVPAVPLHVSVRITGDVVSLTPVLMAAQIPDGRVAPFETVIQRQTAGELTISGVSEAEGLPVDHSVTRSDQSNCKLTLRFKEPFTRQMPVGDFLIQTNVEAEPLRVPYRVVRRGPQFRADPALKKAAQP